MKHNKTAVFTRLCTQCSISRVAGIAIGVGLMGGGLTSMALAEDRQRLPSIMEEIVVTAKWDESIMEVAQSVQYFSGDDSSLRRAESGPHRTADSRIPAGQQRQHPHLQYPRYRCCHHQ